MASYKYTIVLLPAEEGGFTVIVPALPGLVTEGETFEEARAMAEEAIRCHLESMKSRNLEIPLEVEDKRSLLDEIKVEVA